VSDEIRSHRKRKHISPEKRVAVAVLLFLALMAAGFIIRAVLFQDKAYVSKEAPVQLAMAQVEEPEDANSEMSGRYYGLCAKNSTHSIEDFRKTVIKDPVLAAHFSEFDWSAAKLGNQQEDVWAYVSFRKDSIIKRTTKPVKLPKGDQYITDGVRIVRTYCCNDYSAAPAPRVVGMASPVATPAERVDGPPRRVAKSEPSLPSVTAALPEFLDKKPDYFDPPQTFPGPSSFSHGGPTFSVVQQSYTTATIPKEKPPIVTPEPGSFYLMAAGLAAFSLFSLYCRKRVQVRNEA